MELSNYARMFKALANEQRLKIFMIIYTQCCQTDGAAATSEVVMGEEPCCCKVSRTFQKAFSKVCDCMNLSRSTISHHFKELQAAGLISCEREGQTFRCQVNVEAIAALREFLNSPEGGTSL